jgi:hypothetical protein
VHRDDLVSMIIESLRNPAYEGNPDLSDCFINFMALVLLLRVLDHK